MFQFIDAIMFPVIPYKLFASELIWIPFLLLPLWIDTLVDSIYLSNNSINKVNIIARSMATAAVTTTTTSSSSSLLSFSSKPLSSSSLLLSSNKNKPMAVLFEKSNNIFPVFEHWNNEMINKKSNSSLKWSLRHRPKRKRSSNGTKMLEKSLIQRSHNSFDTNHNYYHKLYHGLLGPAPGTEQKRRSEPYEHYSNADGHDGHVHDHKENDSMKTLQNYNENVEQNIIHGSYKWPNTMKNITVTLGRNATFECIFPQLKDFRLVWFHQDHHALLAMHDTVISKNGRISVRSHANTTFYLTIHEVQENDRGFYMCQVNTKPMRIQTGYLEVNVPPAFIEEMTSSDLDVVENSTVSMHCKAKGRPEPEITWRREEIGQQIIIDRQRNESYFSTVKGQHLNLINVTRHQMGAYLCIASNGIAPTISKRIFLGVSFPPIVWTHRKKIDASIGNTGTMECRVESYPKANVYWQKNNQLTPIIYSDRKYTVYFNDSHVSYRFIAKLKINKLQKSDFDKYTCVAKNILGQSNFTVYLSEVEKKKYIPPPPTKPRNYLDIFSTNKVNEQNHHQNLMITTRRPKSGLDINVYKDTRSDVFSPNYNYNHNHNPNDNDDDDDSMEQDMWQYETNYLTPEHLPGKNSATKLDFSLNRIHLIPFNPFKSIEIVPQCFILIIFDLLLSLMILF